MSNNNFNNIELSDEERIEIEQCPFGVEDIPKFLLYIRTRKQSELIQYLDLSNGEKLNLKTPLAMIAHKTDKWGLGEDEIRKIKARKKIFDRIQGKAQNLKRSACGAYNTTTTGGQTSLHERLLSDKKAELLDYFGRMFSLDEVLSIVKKDWGKSDLTPKVLSVFIRENFDEINRLRGIHAEKFDHLRLTHKTSRLEELTWMYNKMKHKYEKSNSREDHRVLLQTVETIRKEVEGDKLTIQQNVNVSLQQEVNIQIRNELMKTIPLKEIILGRLSARLGLVPRDLINDMNTSYYAKLNTLLNETEDTEFEEVGFPSDKAYDFDLIKKVDENKKIEKVKEEQKKKIIVVEDADKKSKGDELKKALMEKLKSNIKKNRDNQQELKNRLG